MSNNKNSFLFFHLFDSTTYYAVAVVAAVHKLSIFKKESKKE